MKLGRLDEETTANLGVIEGGTASNVVAGSCRLVGEARSIDGERAAAVIGEMVDACTWAAGERDCDLDFEVTEKFRGYRLDPDSASAPGGVRRRCAAAGTSPRWSRRAAAATPTRCSPRGYEALLLANGTEANHTPEESVTAVGDGGDAGRLRGRDRAGRREPAGVGRPC